MKKHDPSQHVPLRHETYTVSGLLAYLSFFPVFVAVLMAPGLVLAFGLGALTAVVVKRVRSMSSATQTLRETPSTAQLSQN